MQPATSHDTALLAGRYLLNERIGEGASATVYRAREIPACGTVDFLVRDIRTTRAGL